MLTITAVSFVPAYLSGRHLTPGSPWSQVAAVFGALLLLVPGVFSIMKRTGFTQSPPSWFVAHVVCSSLGTVLIVFHVAGGSWMSAPGVVLLAMLFLVFQGFVARIVLPRSISHLFASKSSSFNFTQPLHIDRTRLQQVVDAKTELLASLDPGAEEAVFSPTFKHWLRSPWRTWRYQRLIEQENTLVGARTGAGTVLQWWRRLHLLAAWLFFVGLTVHVIVGLFFAGYVAGEGDIYWWHISGWGR